MTTAITLDKITANFTKRGVKWRYYKDRASTLALNRNTAPNNQVTPGGFGPLKGLFIHNFASDISDQSSLDYLARGDSARQLPGPLAQFGLDDNGVWVCIGWGSANHASAGDSAVLALAYGDKMPLTRDCVPNPNNAKDLIAPYFLGVEMLYGKAPTDAQRSALITGAASIMEVFGYTGGSIVMHRETHSDRSDPVGFKGFEIRTAVNNQLKVWSTPVLTPTSTSITVTDNPSIRMVDTYVNAASSPAIPGTHIYEYLNGGTWREYDRQTTSTGNSRSVHAFGGNHPIRTRFVPTLVTKYAASVSTSVDIVTVSGEEVLARLTALEAKVNG